MSMLDAFFSKGGFKGSKCKTLLKLTIPRIKLLRNRREIQLKQMRRDIAKLLESGQEATARIRVEHIIREENMMAAQEILELFCELIAVRLPVIETQRECPLDLKEAISSLCFAAPRCSDLPELQQVQLMFAAKYGKEFVIAAAELRPDSGVNRQIIELLSVRAPAVEAKMKLLKEIAEEHEVEWDPAETETEFLKPHEDLLNGPNTNHIITMSEFPLPKEKHDDSIPSKHTEELPVEDDFDDDLDFLNLPEVPNTSVRPNADNPSASEVAPPGEHFPPHKFDSQSNELKPSNTRGEDNHNPTSEYKESLPSGDSPSPQPPFHVPSDQSELTPVEHHDQSPSRPFVASSPQPPFHLPSDPSEPTPVDNQDPTPPFDSSKQTDTTLFVLRDPTPPPRSNSDVNVDLQDVLAAAQTAAESAERAAAAARAAASLAQLRISKYKNESSASEGSVGKPTFDQQNSLDHTSNIPHYDQADNMVPDASGYSHQPQRSVSMEDDPYYSYPNLFSRQDSEVKPGGHS